MSTLIEDTKALLTTLAPAGGVWVGVNKTLKPIYPYITFLRIASTPNVSLGGPSLLQETRFQIDIVAKTHAEAAAMETALEAAMAGWSVQNIPVVSQDFFEDTVDAYRVSKDYTVWATN